MDVSYENRYNDTVGAPWEMRCTICGANVHTNGTAKHTAWHEALAEVLASMVN